MVCRYRAEGLNSDLHGSAEYRAHLITVVARRAVEAAPAKSDIGAACSTKIGFPIECIGAASSVDAMLELLTSRGYLAERSLATVTVSVAAHGPAAVPEGEPASARPRSPRYCRRRWRRKADQAAML